MDKVYLENEKRVHTEKPGLYYGMDNKTRFKKETGKV